MNGVISMPGALSSTNLRHSGIRFNWYKHLDNHSRLVLACPHNGDYSSQIGYLDFLI